MSTKGIIYCAYNNISGKRYIGKSLQPLKKRIQQHYSKARSPKHNYKFVNALRYYPESSWEWSVIADVEIDKLDEYEVFFIADLDTFNNGYNSIFDNYKSKEKRKPCYDSTKIYNLYHKDYGRISATRDELRKLSHALVDKLANLESGRYKSYKGFVLAENRENYREVIDVLTLTHPDYGTYTLTRKEFKKQFGLHRQALSALALKTRQCSKGWSLVKEENEKSN